VFLKEIPQRLIVDEWAEAAKRSFPDQSARMESVPRREKTRNLSFGTPGMAAGTRGALNIPGVQKGFVPSAARSYADSAMDRLFKPGDRVMHRKFGEGTVQAVRGSGADARIMIAFTAYGTKEFSLSIAPIAKLEE
jgi:DNA helicase-2/ATP-dependent DNA helicase PcrA